MHGVSLCWKYVTTKPGAHDNGHTGCGQPVVVLGGEVRVTGVVLEEEEEVAAEEEEGNGEVDVTRVSVLGDGVRPGVVISVRVVEEEEAAAEEVAAEEEEEEEGNGEVDVTRVSVLGDGVRPGVVISVRVVEEEEAAEEEVAAEEVAAEEEGNAAVVVMGRHSQPGQDVVGFTKAVGKKPGAHDTGHTGGGHLVRVVDTDGVEKIVVVISTQRHVWQPLLSYT